MASHSTAHRFTPTATRSPADVVHVLVLDDDIFERRRIRRALKQVYANLKITEITTIEALVPVMEHSQIDVFVVDYQLPLGTGLDALKLIRANPAHRFAATILISGTDEAEMAFKSCMYGGDEFIAKTEMSAARMRDALMYALCLSQVRQGLRLGQGNHVSTLPFQDPDLPETATDLRPALARILRQISFLRQIDGAQAYFSNGAISRLEAACGALFATLDAQRDTYLAPLPDQDWDNSA